MQRGFMMEVPIVAVVIAALMAWLIPIVPPWAGVLVGVAGGSAFLAGAFYLFIVPGWQPGARMARLRSWTVFSVVAAGTVAFVVALVARALR